MSYIGRFAPSPTGPLHMGSLVAAVASYLQARSKQGQWLLRIEDLDPPREIAGATDDIIRTLDEFGFEWDGEIIRQSNRADLYLQALDELSKQDHIYPCTCSRSDIKKTAQPGPYCLRYAGTCREGVHTPEKTHSLRLKTPDENIGFNDYIQKHYQQNLNRDIGDFIVKRADGQFAYQLAVVVDDAEQNISEIVLGSDLLDSTPRQIYIQKILSLPQPDYAHIPVIVNADNEKLSKQTMASPVKKNEAARNLYTALNYLEQRPPGELQNAAITELWDWAISHWDIDNISSRLTIEEQAP